MRVLILDSTLSATGVAYLFVEDKPILAEGTGIDTLVSIVIIVNDLTSAMTLPAGRANDDRASPPAGFAGIHEVPFLIPRDLGVGFGGGSLSRRS